MKLSVVTINYNDALGLQKTFESVFTQSFKDFEYIVIDGGSTDNSLAVIEENKANIHFYISEKDKGVYNAYNKALNYVNGDYVLYINSGDELYDGNVIANTIIQLTGEDLIYGDLFISVSENEKFIKKYTSHLKQSSFMFDSIPTPATFIKKSLFEKVGLFDENLKIVSDWKFFMTAILIKQATYKKINTVVAVFYYGGISTLKGNQNERSKVLKELFPLQFEDYLDLKEYQYYYNSNRVQLLRNLEQNKFGTKLIHSMLIILNKILGKKTAI